MSETDVINLTINMAYGISLDRLAAVVLPGYSPFLYRDDLVA